jgi:hypothetical protein
MHLFIPTSARVHYQLGFWVAAAMRSWTVLSWAPYDCLARRQRLSTGPVYQSSWTAYLQTAVVCVPFYNFLLVDSVMIIELPYRISEVIGKVAKRWGFLHS